MNHFLSSYASWDQQKHNLAIISSLFLRTYLNWSLFPESRSFLGFLHSVNKLFKTNWIWLGTRIPICANFEPFFSKNFVSNLLNFCHLMYLNAFSSVCQTLNLIFEPLEINWFLKYSFLRASSVFSIS